MPFTRKVEALAVEVLIFFVSTPKDTLQGHDLSINGDKDGS